MIYLASPYSDPDREVQDSRFRVVCKAAGLLMLQGKVVFSPIAHTHPIAKAGSLPTGWDFWAKVDEAFMDACSEMMVLMLGGWDKSVGVAAEIELANELRMPVAFVTMEDIENE